jgi:CHRD domain
MVCPVNGLSAGLPCFDSHGVAEFVYDPETRTVKWVVTYSGLSGPATMAHFHGPASQGTKAPLVVCTNFVVSGLPLVGLPDDRYFMLPCILIVTADQLHKFLRMHFMAVRTGGILLWHRAWGTPVGDHMLFLRKFGRRRIRV